MDRTIKRGDIFYAELNPVIGSEQGGTRPVLIISNVFFLQWTKHWQSVLG